MTNEHDAHKKIVRERVKMVLDEPFFGALALRLTPKADPTCNDIWTDGVTLGYNPEFVANMTGGQVRGVLAKCILKCANGHPWRRGGRDTKTWQQSSEVAVEKALLGMKDADPMIKREHGSRFDDKAAERIYSELREEKDPEEQPDTNGDNSGEGESNPDDSGEGQGDSGGNEPSQAPGQSRDAPEEATTEEGEPQDSEGEWRMAVADAAKNVESSTGTMPAWMKLLYEDAATSKVNWKAEMMDFVQEKSKNDYSWKIPNRRFIAQGLYMPSLYDEEVGEIVFAIDTSGSVSAAELGQAAKEINSIVDAVHPSKMHVVYCDSKVVHVDTFDKGDPIVVEMHGGGGTRFDPVFNWIKENHIEPVCTIYLTDMYAPDLREAPNHPTLWISTSKGMVSKHGKTIEIEID